MKATQILSLSVVLTVSAAQSFQSLPDCGKLCVNNMLAKAPELGCAPGDAACLCRKIDFSYGIRDCSTDVCPPQQVASVISYGESYCKSPGLGSINSSQPGPVVSSTSSSTIPASTLTSMTGQGSAVATSALVSLVTHGTEVYTTTLSLTTMSSTETASSPTQTVTSESSSVESSPTSTSDESSSSTGSGSKPTAFAGLAAVAGLAAMML